MNPRPIIHLVVTAGLFAGVAVAYNSGPPASRTGAAAIGGKPAEGTCRDCHNDFAINTSGSIQLLNAPIHYQPGAVYALTVRLTSGQTSAETGRSWGFQLTAVRASDGNGAGTFANVSGQGTMIVAGSGALASRSYAEVASSDHQGSPSPVEWLVNWTAPNPGVGQVRFFMAGVAADGAGGNNGDWVYTGSFATDDVTALTPTTWGAIKTLYRR